MATHGKVRIVEVGPRDGLQNERGQVPTAVKIEFIDRLSSTGLSEIEATSFVSPARVPQLADASAVMQGIRRRPGVSYSVLVPNLRGFELALASGVSEIAVFVAATEGFSQRNINCSIAESLARLAPVVSAAHEHHIVVRGYVSCALGCPIQGPVTAAEVAAVVRRLDELGCGEISVADTLGIGTPDQARRMIEAVSRHVAIERLRAHYHDTYGRALANAYVSLEMGLRTFESSVAGLGGCPFAEGAGGNVATEDLVHFIEALGYETGIDLNQVMAAGDFICTALGRRSDSKVALALRAKTAKTATGSGDCAGSSGSQAGKL